MKSWILYSGVFFVLFLVVLARGLHKNNWAFTLWLAAGVSAQVFFALADRQAEWFGGAKALIEAAAWFITTIALVCALLRRTDWVNEVILCGLAANVLLHGIALALVFKSQTGGAKSPPWLPGVSNLAGLGPALWMALSLSGARLDRLPAWVKQIPHFVRDDKWREAFACALRATVAGARAIWG